MPEAWLNFAVVVLVQLILFIAHAWYAKRLSDVPRLLGYGVLIGVVVGLFFDLVIGKFLGLSSYALGFGLFFLIINGALSYGLFAANTSLMQHARLAHFYIWTVGIVAVYEITNQFFRVWTWEFALPHILFLIVLSVGYFGGAILVAVIAHVFFKHRFLFIDTLLKKFSPGR